MKKTTVAMAMLLALGVGACGGMDMTRSDVTLTTIRVPKKTSPAGDPVDCGASHGNRCVVAITVTPSTDGGCSSVSMPEYIALGDMRRHQRIEWVLPTGYQFCARSGDGVYLDDVNAPDDVFDLDPNVRCSQTLEWKRRKQDSNKYSYTLRFRNAANTVVCVKDPWIRN